MTKVESKQETIKNAHWAECSSWEVCSRFCFRVWKMMMMMVMTTTMTTTMIMKKTRTKKTTKKKMPG